MHRSLPPLLSPLLKKKHASRRLVDFLTGPSREAAALRRACVFKIVPMLNVDGTVLGNYR
jgi:hypothetical protein